MRNVQGDLATQVSIYELCAEQTGLPKPPAQSLFAGAGDELSTPLAAAYITSWLRESFAQARRLQSNAELPFSGRAEQSDFVIDLAAGGVQIAARWVVREGVAYLTARTGEVLARSEANAVAMKAAEARITTAVTDMEAGLANTQSVGNGFLTIEKRSLTQGVSKNEIAVETVEYQALREVAGSGKNVIWRDVEKGAVKGTGDTTDALINGVSYDVYSPTTSNMNSLLRSLSTKNSQLGPDGGGIVLDLSRTNIPASEFSNILERVVGKLQSQGSDVRIRDIIITGRK